MRVSILCTDRSHPVWGMLEALSGAFGYEIFSEKKLLPGGDLLLLVSCTEILGREERSRYGRVLVIHESALPQGRGWSPFAWQVISGAREITVSLLEAEDRVDTGDVLREEVVRLEGHELADELEALRDAARSSLIRWAVENSGAPGVRQRGDITYYPRRTPADSRIDPLRSLAEQFDRMRVCEPRFPAFFDLRGHRYELTLRKAQS